MHKWLAVWLVTGSFIAMSGCARDVPPHRETFPALGTLVTIEILATEPQQAIAATVAVERYLQRIGHDWYAWGDGELGRVNALLARGEPAPVSTELAALIQRSLKFKTRSDGYFDPTVGLLVELWGLHRNDRSGEPPTQIELDQWVAGRAGREAITIADGLISAPTPLKLDLGGFAKGTALAGAMRILQQHGIAHALVDAGGDLQVAGMRGQRAWQIGIRHPRLPDVLATVALKPGEAIVTSGDYERYFQYADTRYHHLLDPRSGLPVTHTASASVINLDPEIADAAATALMAGGPEQFVALTERMGIKMALLVTGDGDLIMTAAMRARLRNSADPSRSGNAKNAT